MYIQAKYKRLAEIFAVYNDMINLKREKPVYDTAWQCGVSVNTVMDALDAAKAGLL